MITLRNLEKFYEGGYGRSYVLRRVNIDIKEGEFRLHKEPLVYEEMEVKERNYK